MRRRRWGLGIAIVSLVSLVAVAVPTADAGHRRDERSRNLVPAGHIEEPRSATALFDPTAPGDGRIHTDIAFQGRTAFQGNWLGLSIRDIRNPFRPRPISFTECTGGQGDVVVFQDVLVRTWDGSATTGAPAGATCDGEEVPQGFAGMHVFDISNLRDPKLVGSVEMSFQSTPASCGLHTATGVPDLKNNRLLIYGSPSTFACEHINVAEVPLDAPEDAALIRQVDTGRPCHDTGVILGQVNRAACAGGNGFTMMKLDPNNLDDPEVLFSKDVNEEDLDGPVTIGHSAAFSFDGRTLIFGHEPGGGSEARCTEDDPVSDRSAMFFDTRTGELQGLWTIPRPQTGQENCTFHNLNVIPLRNGQDVLVHGSYQAGTGVVDFTNRAKPKELAFSDPAPIPLPENPIFCLDTGGCELGGAWSSHWYNNVIYETNIGEGLNIFLLIDKLQLSAKRLDRLNPQTQTFSILR